MIVELAAGRPQSGILHPYFGLRCGSLVFFASSLTMEEKTSEAQALCDAFYAPSRDIRLRSKMCLSILLIVNRVSQF